MFFSCRNGKIKKGPEDPFFRSCNLRLNAAGGCPAFAADPAGCAGGCSAVADGWDYWDCFAAAAPDCFVAAAGSACSCRFAGCWPCCLEGYWSVASFPYSLSKQRCRHHCNFIVLPEKSTACRKFGRLLLVNHWNLLCISWNPFLRQKMHVFFIMKCHL